MPEYPELKWINVAGLVEEAGDPWLIDSTLQSGKPGAINDLSRAFFEAAECTAATYQEFVDTQARFRQAWNRDNDGHPINDAAEVQRATTALMFQKDKLPQVSSQLAAVATELAVAQRASHRTIKELNNELVRIDDLIDHAIADDQDTAWLEHTATKKTSDALRHVQQLRDEYSSKLSRALTYLRAELSYDPAILQGLDGDGETTPEQQGRESTDWYDANQRSRDEAVANSPTADPAEKGDATARLRDYATTVDMPTSEAGALAAERLDDFRMANFVGSLPRDPILGGDARDRARDRLDLHRSLQQGFGQIPPMTRDQATRTLNDGEQFARVTATQRALAALRSLGMSDTGAQLTLEHVLTSGETLSRAEEPFKLYEARPPSSRLERLTQLLSPADAGLLGKFAGGIGNLTDIVTLADAITDKVNGGTWGEACSRGGGALAGLVGGAGATWLLPAALNPAAAVGIVFLGGFLAATATEELGAGICSDFDPVPVLPK